MTIKQDLLRVGYLPENLPPAFGTHGVSQYFDRNPVAGYLVDGADPVRAAVYSASKRGMSRRVFSVINPATAHDLAQFVEAHRTDFDEFFTRGGGTSLSAPRHTPTGDRAVEIGSHAELEAQRLQRLAGYRFIARTDVSRFYHSTYTHSVPWAFHGKAASKRDRRVNSAAVYFNRLDQILRQGQDGQTVGIPVGPDASRYVAELISTAVDNEFRQRCDVADYQLVRHVDDVWIGAHTHADAERALWRYREALREFELDINETKTRIYSENFRFSDAWPSDVSSRLEAAISSPESRRAERLRAALEYAFSLSVSDGDDGILKYAIRQLDRSEGHWDAWETIQPFLMRAAIHFGHTVDYVARVLVWRELARGDLDHNRWTTIIQAILDRQGRLGNDGEVCWSLYASLRLRVPIPRATADNIIRNCGAMSVLSLLNCVDSGLADASAFDTAFQIVQQESANGPLWPVFLEWRTRQWPRHAEVGALIENDLIARMATDGVTLFNPEQLTRVFAGIDRLDFASVASAIESRVSLYDDDEDTDDEDEPDDVDF